MTGTVHSLPRRPATQALVTKQQLARHLGRSTRWIELKVRDERLPSGFGDGVAGTLGAHRTGGTDPTDFERGGALVMSPDASEDGTGSRDLIRMAFADPQPQTGRAVPAKTAG